MKPSEVADVLDKAADVLLVRGWSRDDYQNEDGGVCALGALRVAVNGSPFKSVADHPAANAAADALAVAGGCELDDIDLWNNYGADSIDEVLDAFRHAAKSLREEAGQQ